MQRRRDIAAGPVRSASETWSTIDQLIADTLIRSPYLGATAVSTTLGNLAQAGMMLIAAGHLESEPLVLIAADLQLSIATVSGDEAFTVEENLNPVPGAADARDWTLHVPTPAPHTETLLRMLAGLEHISTAKAAVVASAPTTLGKTTTLNLQALAERGRDR